MTDALTVIRGFTEGLEPRAAGTVQRLVEVIQGPPFAMDVALKWGRPTFAVSGDFHHWVCSIAVTKHAVALTFHYGGLLQDRKGVFIAGESKFLRKIEFKTAQDVDEAVIQDLIQQALDKRQYFKDNWQRIQKE